MCSDSKKIEGYIGWKSVKDDAIKREKKYNNISIFIEEITPFIDSISKAKADIISESLQNADRLKEIPDILYQYVNLSLLLIRK